MANWGHWCHQRLKTKEFNKEKLTYNLQTAAITHLDAALVANKNSTRVQKCLFLNGKGFRKLEID